MGRVYGASWRERMGVLMALFALGLMGGAGVVHAQSPSSQVPLSQAPLTPHPASQGADPAGKASDEPAYWVEEIVVQGRKQGPVVWTLEQGTSRLYLVGWVTYFQVADTWDKAYLQGLIKSSSKVYYAYGTFINPLDLVGFMLADKSAMVLKKGQSLESEFPADVVRAYRQAAQDLGVPDKKLMSVMPSLSNHEIRRAYWKAHNLSAKDSLQDLAKKLARQDGVATHALLTVTSGDIISIMREFPKEAQIACMQKTVRLTQTDPRLFVRIQTDWERGRIRPKDIRMAEDVTEGCFDQSPKARAMIERLSGRYATALKHELAQGRTTLMLADVYQLIKPGGILDSLEAQGVKVSGPRWRAEA